MREDGTSFEVLLRIGELTHEIELRESEAEALRHGRAALMAKARQEGVSLQRLGDAAGMTHAAVRKSLGKLSQRTTEGGRSIDVVSPL